MEKRKKEKVNLHSIYVKILLLVLISVIAFFALNIAYIIPRAKSTIKTVNENNMQDLATLCSEIVEQEIVIKGAENVDYETLKPIFDGRGLKGIESSSIYVVDGDGIFLYHKKEEKIGTEVFNDDVKGVLKQIPTGIISQMVFSIMLMRMALLSIVHIRLLNLRVGLQLL